MPNYLLMVLENEAAHTSQSPKAMAELIAHRAKFAQDLRRTDHLRDGGYFRPSAEGKRVSTKDGRVHVEDGPFVEDGKSLAGYYLVAATGLDEAVELGRTCPTMTEDDVDVRPVMKGQVDPSKEEKPGKVFGFAVLGKTATEEAWVDVMDRIDAETSGCFPPDSFLGGVRLEPPRTGRGISTRAERRSTFDGPFLESKEVIGGLFFLRVANVEEAVRWAGTSRFVVHGTLEIRELWRS